MQKIRQKAILAGKALGLTGAALLAFVNNAMAAADVTAITGVLTDVATVAAAVFGVYVAIKAAKFIRRAL